MQMIYCSTVNKLIINRAKNILTVYLRWSRSYNEGQGMARFIGYDDGGCGFHISGAEWVKWLWSAKPPWIGCVIAPYISVIPQAYGHTHVHTYRQGTTSAKRGRLRSSTLPYMRRILMGKSIQSCWAMPFISFIKWAQREVMGCMGDCKQ